MFETSIAKANQGPRTLRVRYLPLAIGVHLLVLTGVLVFQAWAVSAVADPPVYETFRVSLPPPPPPPGGQKATPKPERAPAPAPATPSQPEQVPETIVAELPDSPSSNEVDGGVTLDGEGEGPGPLAGDGPGLEPAPPEPDPTVPVELDSTMIPPVLIHRVEPRYSRLALTIRKTGRVVVQATVTREGHVTDVRVLRSVGYGLDEAAIDAVRQWKFKPAERFGRPAAVLYNLTVNFELR